MYVDDIDDIDELLDLKVERESYLDRDDILTDAGREQTLWDLEDINQRISELENS